MGGGGGGSGGGVERIQTKPAKMQLTHKKNAIKNNPLSKVPSVGGMFAQGMGAYNIAQQQKALDEGGTAIAVPGTSFAPQGQAYTEAPGMISSPKTAAEAGLPTASLGKFAVFKDSDEARGEIAGQGLGYIGDVAGVVKEREFLGQKTKTFTGKTGYSPSGEKVDEPKGGGGQEKTLVAQAETEEAAPESAMAMLPGETPSQYRRRVRRFGGGTIVEGGGVLYK